MPTLVTPSMFPDLVKDQAKKLYTLEEIRSAKRKQNDQRRNQEQARRKEKREEQYGTPPLWVDVVNIRPSYTTVYSKDMNKEVFKESEAFTENKKNLKLAHTEPMQYKPAIGVTITPPTQPAPDLEAPERPEISKKAKVNINTAIDWLLHIAQPKKIVRTFDNSTFVFKVNFVTLTLPASQFRDDGSPRHTDQTIKAKVLDPFLQELRTTRGLKNYLWKAEAQKTTGNIHFHLLTDIFIHYEALRNLWNKHLNSLGYVDRFEAVHSHRNPNSTDIHSIRNVKKLGAYLSAYLTKKKDARAIQGRKWFLSQTLQKLKSCKVEILQDDQKAQFEKMFSAIPETLKKKFDYCTVLKVGVWNFFKNGFEIFKNAIEDFLKPLLMPPENAVFYV